MKFSLLKLINVQVTYHSNFNPNIRYSFVNVRSECRRSYCRRSVERFCVSVGADLCVMEIHLGWRRDVGVARGLVDGRSSSRWDWIKFFSWNSRTSLFRFRATTFQIELSFNWRCNMSFKFVKTVCHFIVHRMTFSTWFSHSTAARTGER